VSWRHHDIAQADFAAASVTPSAQSVMRFTANDDDPQNIVEGGLDVFVVTEVICPIRDSDINRDSRVDLRDFSLLAGVLHGSARVPLLADPVRPGR